MTSDEENALHHSPTWSPGLIFRHVANWHKPGGGGEVQAVTGEAPEEEVAEEEVTEEEVA